MVARSKYIALSRQARDSGAMKNLIASARSMLVLLVALTACGGDDDDDLTAGKFCSSVGGAFCDRLISCGDAQSSQRPMCLDAFVEGCCKDDGRCNERPESSEAEVALRKFINDCSVALKTHACSELQTRLPTACTATPRLVSPDQTPARPVPATLDPSGNAGHAYKQGRTAGRALLGR